MTAINSTWHAIKAALRERPDDVSMMVLLGVLVWTMWP